MTPAHPSHAQLDAVLHALAGGAPGLADALAAMTPEEVAAALAPDGPDEPGTGDRPEHSRPGPAPGRLVWENFTGTVTDSAGRKRTYLDGKQVANPESPAGGDRPAAPAHADATGSVDLSAEAADPALKDDPTLLAKVKESVGKAVDLARRAAYEVAYRSPQILGAWTAVFDGPDDLKKIGYNPSFSGADGPKTADPVKDAVGVPAHMAAGLVVKVGAAAVAWARKKLGLTESLAGYDPDHAAELIHALLYHAADALGLPPPPAAAVIAAALSDLPR